MDYKKLIIRCIWLITGVGILCIPFGVQPILFDDSGSYLAERFRLGGGIVPLYPLFLSVNRKIFGEFHF